MDKSKADQLYLLAVDLGEVDPKEEKSDIIHYKGADYKIVNSNIRIPASPDEVGVFRSEIERIFKHLGVNINDLSSKETFHESPPDFIIDNCAFDLEKLFPSTKKGIKNFLKELQANIPFGLRRGLDQPSTTAFYRPFHFSKYWGIYLDPIKLAHTATNVLQYNNNETNRSKIYGLDFWDCFLLVFFKTFYHEMYHHKFEMLATKFELVTRKPFYKEGFNYYYCATYLTDFCLEEAFANVYGLYHSIDFLNSKNMISFSKNDLRHLLRESLLKKSPKGYRVSYELTEPLVDHEKFENRFIELVYKYSFERVFGYQPFDLLDNDLWELFTYRLDPLINTENEVTFILPV